MGKILQRGGNILPTIRCIDEFPADIAPIPVGIWIAKDKGHMPRAEIEAVLNRMRPLLQADGGDITLVDVSNRKAFVRLTGRCAGCPSSHLTLHIGIEMAIREALPDFDELVIV
jgi:Fe-S cluster biogenesis protein NfuA